jgi:uncharacterized protein YndB with AHSA1/START domain
MDDRFEATFVVDAPAETVWERLTRAEPLKELGGRPAGLDPNLRWLAAWEAAASDVEVEPGRRLRAVKEMQPCKGTEILVTLEHAGTGTKVTVVQSGFGAGFEAALEDLTIGWYDILADIELFLATGVRGGRHPRPWASFGARVRATGAGLEVTQVREETFAGRAGLEKGDIVITVAGAPISSRIQLETVMRVCHSGDDVKVSWARGSQRMSATARL